MIKKDVIYPALIVLPIPVLFLSLFVGPSGEADARHLFFWLREMLFDQASPIQLNKNLIYTILWEVRMPRILLTFLVGGALACSGSAFQTLFRNPLVSPYILGLSSGAAFGAALAMGTSFLPVQVSAFVFGIMAVGISYTIARTGKSISIVTMVLSGIIVSGVFTALLAIVQYLIDPFKLQGIVHWTMGNLHNAGWSTLKSTWAPVVTGMAGLVVLRWRMNVLALGDNEARSVGLNPEREKLLILVPATLAASAAVAAAGVITLIGLVVPHMVRMMIGPDNTRCIPTSITFGGTFLLLVDNLSRTIASFEIPIGIFTMLIGAPFFLFLLKRAKIGWEV